MITYNKILPLLESRGLDIVIIHGKKILKKYNSSALCNKNLIRNLPHFYTYDEIKNFLVNNSEFNWDNQKIMTN